MTYKTEQEQFWSGNFGTEYIQRNKSDHLLASNLNFFSKALDKIESIDSVVEFGANIGMNLKALKLLYPHQEQYAVEINPDAAKELAQLIDGKNIFNGSILDFVPAKKTTLSLIKGVLIHINPEVLQDVYTRLYEASKKYILICEYYNPTPVSINYRGHSDKLFKRDFAGEFMDKYPDVELINYGFTYRRDPVFPQDDITWFLMRKTKS
jgi:pseudaminic acid biosynthesis-associated methylase